MRATPEASRQTPEPNMGRYTLQELPTLQAQGEAQTTTTPTFIGYIAIGIFGTRLVIAAYQLCRAKR